MEKLARLYSLDWFRRRGKSKKGPHISSGYLAEVVHEKLHPRRVVDLGAGTLAFVNRMAELDGVKLAYGIEGSEFNAEFAKGAKYFAHDLRKPFPFAVLSWSKFDLVTSWDVFEHVPEKYESVLVETVLKFANKYVLISTDSSSWGVGHVNCKPKRYWRKLFEKAGLHFDKDLTDSLKRRILREKRITSHWYAHHLSAFRVPK